LGRMKEFAFWLAEQVYVKQLNNAAIKVQFDLTWNIAQPNPTSKWLDEQVEAGAVSWDIIGNR
jgi:hypothetical protein